MTGHSREIGLEKILEAMRLETGLETTTLKVLGEVMPEAAFEHAENKKFVFSLKAIPSKYKMLMSIAVAAALGSDRCTQNYIVAAKNNGFSKEEIIEAILLARFVKATTVIGTSIPGLHGLLEEEETK